MYVLEMWVWDLLRTVIAEASERDGGITWIKFPSIDTFLRERERGERETSDYEPFALHAPIDLGSIGECDQEEGEIEWPCLLDPDSKLTPLS